MIRLSLLLTAVEGAIVLSLLCARVNINCIKVNAILLRKCNLKSHFGHQRIGKEFVEENI